jgi:HTH-type transcriptional regulator / antitoxin MqsA
MQPPVITECAQCGGPVRRLPTDMETRVRTREVVTTRHLLSRCVKCDEVYLDQDEMRAVDRAAGDIVREREGLLAPEEILALRESLGISQAAFERLLRVGPKTVGRWERGTAFQSRGVDSLLRILRDVPAARKFLAAFVEKESNGDGLTSH